MKLFATAFMQVFLVSSNILFISRMFYPGLIVAGFGISWFWSGNVIKISIGNNRDRFIYSLGAMLGSITGVTLTNLIQ